jgi:hypothetical protein
VEPEDDGDEELPWALGLREEDPVGGPEPFEPDRDCCDQGSRGWSG